MGKILAGSIVLSALVAGVLLYYLQVYAYYDEITLAEGESVVLTPLGSDQPEPILFDGYQGIDSDTSPLRYRACFTTSHSQAMLTETYELYEGAEPRNAPDWFACFNAQEIGAALESGEALAFLGKENIVYGFDRVTAITSDGRGYTWHQINHCGEKVFDGQPAPEGCPPAPEN